VASSDNARWYAVQCQPHRERAASVHLAHQKFSAFLPLRKKARRHARRIDTVRAPFFPGYLFIRLDLTRDRWRSVNGTFGVVRLVANGERPAPVPRGFVEALKDACDGSDVMALRTELVPGQSIRVLTGPFVDLVGRLDRVGETDRVRVMLEVMGGQIPVLLPREDVVAADSSL
jgi:transcription elongation factor/antiterminator RfaH